MAAARTELRTALDRWGLNEIEDAALLVLSELLTNAVLHAHVSPGREIETHFLRLGGRLRIEVHDAADELPERLAADDEACNGRGLALVAALAVRWDVGERAGPGKRVWAELAAPAKGGAHDAS